MTTTPAMPELDPADIVVDIVRKPMGGFAFVNTNGVIVTHKPSGIAVTVDAHKSMHENRQAALNKLRTTLATLQAQPAAEVSDADIHDIAAELELDDPRADLIAFARAILALRPQSDHTDTARCIKARNDLNAALHGDGALIDDLEHAVANACAILKRRRSFAGDRADFEAWMSEGGKWPKAVERSHNGDYLLLQTATNWATWQACASLLAPQQATPEPLTLGPLAKRNIYDAIRGAYDLGYNDARNARTVPGDSAPGYDGRSVEEDHGGALFNTLNRRLAATPEPVGEQISRAEAVRLINALVEGDTLRPSSLELLRELTRPAPGVPEGFAYAPNDTLQPKGESVTKVIGMPAEPSLHLLQVGWGICGGDGHASAQPNRQKINAASANYKALFDALAAAQAKGGV